MSRNTGDMFERWGEGSPEDDITTERNIIFKYLLRAARK